MTQMENAKNLAMVTVVRFIAGVELQVQLSGASVL